MLPTENAAAAPLSAHPMAQPPPPSPPLSSTKGTSSPSLSDRVLEATSKKPDEVDPFGEKLPESIDKNQKPPSSEKPGDNLARDSYAEILKFMVWLDPSGFLLVLCLLSTLLVSWRFWWLLEQPADQFWNTSLVLCLLIFLWTISVSDSPKMVVSQFSHILLLSCAATHFLGPMNGMMVMYIGTLYAACLLGYVTLGYCQRLGIGKSAQAIITSKVKGRKHDEVGASLVCSVITVFSLVCFGRISWLVLTPDMSQRNFFEAFDYTIEIWPEIGGSVGMWIVYITQFDLGGAVLSMDTFVWVAPSLLFSGFLIAVSLFLVVGDAVAIYFLWIGTMPIVGLFGYVLALRACCKTIIASCHPSTKWEQRLDKVYFTIELADAKDVMLKLKPDGRFNFSAKGPDEIQYGLHLELFGAIIIEESKVAVAPGTRCYLIKKAESNWWPRLLKKEGKPPVFLKVELDKWRDEDDEDTGSDDFGDMVFMKLDKGGDDGDDSDCW